MSTPCAQRPTEHGGFSSVRLSPGLGRGRRLIPGVWARNPTPPRVGFDPAGDAAVKGANGYCGRMGMGVQMTTVP